MNKTQTLLLLLWLTIPAALSAQRDTLVPFRVGDLFGLSDLKGNIKLEPKYDIIEPLSGQYFKYTNLRVQLDTTKSHSGKITVKKKVNNKSGVLLGTKPIVTSGEHGHFTLVEEALLVGSKMVDLGMSKSDKLTNYKGTDGNFYSRSGKKLLQENVKSYMVLDHVLDRNGNPVKQTHITIYVQHQDETISFLVFDVAAQKMVEPLLSHISNPHFYDHKNSETCMMLTYVDASYQYYDIMVDFDENKKRHIIKPVESKHQCFCSSKNDHAWIKMMMPDKNSNSYGNSGTYGGGAQGYGSGTGNGGQTTGSKAPSIKNRGFWTGDNQTLTFNDIAIKLGAGQSFHFEQGSKKQSRPLIYSDGKKYGLIHSDTHRSGLIYDTLRYANSYSNTWYLAGKRSNPSEDIKMGFIDQTGKEVISMLYTDIAYGIEELKGAFYTKVDTSGNVTIDFSQSKELVSIKYSDQKPEENKDPYVKHSYLVVTKDGKKGLIDLSNKSVLPFQCDDFWLSKLSFDARDYLFSDGYPVQPTVDAEFYVYKKNGGYGIFQLNGKLEVTYETKADVPMKPIARYKDYAGKKGFDLIMMVDGKTSAFYFAGSDGKLYYKK